MRKRLLSPPADEPRPAEAGQPLEDHLDLERLAAVEVTSEDTGRPVESALLPGGGPGWRAAGPGPQLLRILFDEPQRLRRVRLEFVESEHERTQEFVLRWSAGAGEPLRDIARQRWNFSPHGGTREVENYAVDLPSVAVLELAITPDVAGGPAKASLSSLSLA